MFMKLDPRYVTLWTQIAHMDKTVLKLVYLRRSYFCYYCHQSLAIASILVDAEETGKFINLQFL
jgi:hypothetical protein